MNNVRANAVATIVGDAVTSKGRCHLWRVEVSGLPPHVHERIYSIEGGNGEDAERIAAFEGIRRFVEEMENMNAS